MEFTNVFKANIAPIPALSAGEDTTGIRDSLVEIVRKPLVVLCLSEEFQEPDFLAHCIDLLILASLSGNILASNRHNLRLVNANGHPLGFFNFNQIAEQIIRIAEESEETVEFSQLAAK
ncbi:hypothetical protein T265_12162 [Opisthorchis viverrini]|uniref:Uncharacterized protein n=1 Tax=Opisthorchis viverrini TaxID=6198 RepID=A0A074Z6A0_OPIVI|nr:hypothetical protein T265_12162 [Opisthorchis viverrini]KER18770.1 hypothetical protein T265_12162 [Opisthorchis viverrini]